jgi:hypothetical protein
MSEESAPYNIGEKPKRRLSISQLETLSKCGEQYRRRYILHQRTPSGISMIVGGVVDKAVTKNLEAKMTTGQLLGRDELREFVMREYAAKIAEESEEGKEGIGFTEKELLEGKDESIQEGKEKAVRLTLLHADVVAPKLNPLYLQRHLSVELPGYPFDIGGILDIQEVDSVRDTKAKSKTPSKDAAETDDQLTVYAFLVLMNDGMIPPKLILDCLIDTKIPKYVPFETTRVEEDFNALFERTSVACQAIESGIFMPARESDWWCSKDYCGFWQTCKYVKRSRRLNS